MDDDTRKTFVETSTMRSLRHAVEAGRSPILLSGARGMGKTAMLRALARDWKDRGYAVAFVDLWDHRAVEHLIESIAQQMGMMSNEKRRGSIVSSSSASSEEAWIDALADVKEGLIILDELDAIPNRDRRAIATFRQLVRTGLRVVVSSAAAVKELSVFLGVVGYDFTLIEINSWSAEEISQIVPDEVGPAATLRIRQIAAGNPRVARLAIGHYKGQAQETADLASDADSTPMLVRRLLSEEAGQFDYPSDEMWSLMIRLTNRGTSGLHRAEVTPKEEGFLEFSALVRRDGDIYRLAEVDLARDLINAADVLPSVRLGDLIFGAEEAERDALLDDHFLPPPGLDELRSGRRNIVVGDRGAGKSALFRALMKEPNKRVDAPTIQFVRMEDPADLVLRLESDGKTLLSAEQFRAAWLLSLACTLATRIRTSSTQQEKLARRLRETIPLISTEADEGTKGRSFLRNVRSLWRESRGMGVKFQFGPVTLESPKAQLALSGRPIDVDKFLRETARALKAEGRRVIVAIDRIDEVHKYERAIQEPLVQGLFLAESSPEYGAEISLLIFIRTDLFETYEIQEKNKLVTRHLSLHWSENALLRMMVERVFSNKALVNLSRTVWHAHNLDDALPALFPREVEGRPFEDWLWHSLRNGNKRVSPRQLVLLLALARDAALEGERPFGSLPLLTEARMRSAMTSLSELSFSEATTDFRVAPTFLRSLRAGKIEEFALTEVEGLFAKSEGETAAQVDMLERLGVLERLVVRDERGHLTSRLRVPPLYTRCWHVSA